MPKGLLKKMKYKIIYLFSFSLLFFTPACGDVFSKKTQIVGSYYLADGEAQGNYAIYYLSTNGSLIQKIPPKVIEYGYFDSLLVSKIFDKKSMEMYYIINMTKDYDVAKEELFRFGPLDSISFNQFFNGKDKIKWLKVK